MVFEGLYKKNMFFTDDMFFFQKTCQTTFFLWSIKQNKNFCLKIMNASLRRKNSQELIFAKDTHLGPLWIKVQPVYEPAFDQPILKFFVINADSLFAKNGKLTTR